MKKNSIWTVSAVATFLCALGACSNSTSLDDEDYDEPVATSSSSITKTSSSSTGTFSCKTITETLAAPTDFIVSKDTDSSWTLSWDYSRNDSREESGFKIQSLDLESSSPSWEVEGTTKTDVTIYKLKGAKKVGKYYRVVAYDTCGVSKESNRVQIKSDGQTTVDTATVAEELIPTDVAITRIAPSVWELSWKYSDTKDDPNRKFIIQKSKLKNFKWTSIKTSDGKNDMLIDGNVRHYYIETLDEIETYYRMAVINNGDTSSFTDAIQLTPNIAYREFMSLDVPGPSSKITLTYITSIDRDDDPETDDKTYVSAVGTYTITDNPISKYIIDSKYTDTVYYEARWFNSFERFSYFKGNCDGRKKTDACDSCYWTETFPYQEPSISKSISVYDDFYDVAKTTTVREHCYDSSATEKIYAMCLEHYLSKLCGYYLQLRVVWKDKNGATDWSEWTQPFSISDISGADAICNH